ncbi:MAG TPA: molecular chaperone TorD family protein [Thermoanaerobaculia bacterium]|nr:molecular chaperone TorD family protein [Thermoanaerobaculia bacterium]
MAGEKGSAQGDRPELFRALGVLSEAPRPEMQGIADLLELGPLPAPAAHSELFLFQLYPYASVYLGAEGMMGGEARDRIAGFWRALGQEPPGEPDHLAVMLALYARLGELEEGAAGPAEGAAPWRRARHAYLWEHLASWLPVFLLKLDQIAGSADAFYGKWAALLREALQEEVEALGGPSQLPAHLRDAPSLAAPQTEGLDSFLQSLLSPVRSGIVLVRADLARAARDLGLGLRLGERRLALRSLLEQETAATLSWLAIEATSWATRHLPEIHLAAPLALFWRSRAETTACLLTDLGSEISTPKS